MSNSTPSQTAPAPGSGEKLDRLKTLLHEMFQLDRGDLGFGLYRIMNLKAAEVTTFLDRDLLPQVKTAMRLTSNEERAGLEDPASCLGPGGCGWLRGRCGLTCPPGSDILAS